MADINAACLAAANALQALGHLQPGFSSDISPRLTENKRRQSRNISEADETQSTQLSQSGEPQQNISIQSRLQSCFPTIASRVGGNTVRNSGVSKRSKPRKSGTPGRPKKLLCTKILVVIPGPDIEKVPTHSSRVKLEERELVCHEFPFDKEWDEATLKNEILKQFPTMINFDFVKVRCFIPMIMI